ncbi:hypothetical protein K3495_g16757, partial [Podosphaera aphanis]
MQLHEDSKLEQAKKLRNQDHKLDQQSEKLNSINSRFDKLEKMIETLASRPDNNTDNPDSERLTSLKSHLPIVQPIVGKDNEVAPPISDFDFQPNTKRPSFLPPFVPRPRTIPPKPLFGSNDVRNTSNYPHKAARVSADPVTSPLGSQKSPQNVTNHSTLYPKPNINSPTTFNNHHPKTDTDTYNLPKFKSFFCPPDNQNLHSAERLPDGSLNLDVHTST